MNRDPGLQPERTALAWRRTALAMLVNGGLLVRAAVEAESPALWTVSLMIVLASGVMFVTGGHRDRELMRAPVHTAPHAGLPLLLVATVWAASAAAIVSMLP